MVWECFGTKCKFLPGISTGSTGKAVLELRSVFVTRVQKRCRCLWELSLLRVGFRGPYEEGGCLKRAAIGVQRPRVSDQEESSGIPKGFVCLANVLVFFSKIVLISPDTFKAVQSAIHR